MTAFLVLALVFIGAFITGYFIERMRIPWVFAALIVGAFVGPSLVPELEAAGVGTLAEMGMLLLLFTIGLELDVREFLKAGRLVVRSTLAIILFEMVVGAILLHFLFGYGWQISLLVALSFATVGEAVLLPILEEAGLVNSRLGHVIIGVGTLDDAFELVAVLWASALVGAQAGHGFGVWVQLLALLLLFVLTAGVRLLRRLHVRLTYPRLGAALPVALFVFFLFVGVAGMADMEALGAILAGIALRAFLPHDAFKRVEEEVRAIAYGFFAPIFFFWVGAHVDVSALAAYPLAVLVLTLATAAAKIVASLVTLRNYLGWRQALIAGIGLCVRFSTSIVIVKILHDSGIIGSVLFSVLVAATAAFTLIVPFAFSLLVRRHAR